MFNNLFRHVTLAGLGTAPSSSMLQPGTILLAVSFRLLAAEYLLHLSLADSINDVSCLPDGFWHITREALQDFGLFYQKVTETMVALLPAQTDIRKQKLFNQLYTACPWIKPGRPCPT